MRATFEFFESDRDMVKLAFRDSLALGERFDRHLAGIYEAFIGEIEETIEAAQAAGEVVEAPSRMVAFSVAARSGRGSSGPGSACVTRPTSDTCWRVRSPGRTQRESCTAT